MEGTIWFVLADADRARILELSEPGARPRLVEELTAPRVVAAPGQHWTDEEMQWFARRIADRLEQAYAEARFEFLRFAAGPRFLDRLHAEIDKHPDLHRAELDWLAKDLWRSSTTSRSGRWDRAQGADGACDPAQGASS